MKYLKQFGIIAGASFAGELLYAILPFPIPASVYGLVLMMILLMTHVVKLEMVEDTADFFISIMALFFIPSSVGVMTTVGIIGDSMIQLLIVCAVSTIVVMILTGLTAQIVMKFVGKKEDK